MEFLLFRNRSQMYHFPISLGHLFCEMSHVSPWFWEHGVQSRGNRGAQFIRRLVPRAGNAAQATNTHVYASMYYIHNQTSLAVASRENVVGVFPSFLDLHVPLFSPSTLFFCGCKIRAGRFASLHACITLQMHPRFRREGRSAPSDADDAARDFRGKIPGPTLQLPAIPRPHTTPPHRPAQPRSACPP